MTEGRYLLPSDPTQVLARHGAVLTAAAHQRVRQLVWAAAALLFTVFAVWWLGIAFGQLGSGLAQLGKLIAQMFPPSTGSHFPLLLQAMGETLAIAFLGTLIAAIILAGLPGSALWAIGLLVGINLLFGGATLIGVALAARNA